MDGKTFSNNLDSKYATCKKKRKRKPSRGRRSSPPLPSFGASTAKAGMKVTGTLPVATLQSRHLKVK